MSEARGWLVVIGLALGVCVSNGFARFAYGLILPAMREDLAWSFAQAGWMNTANAFGYIIGAAATLALVTRAPPAQIFSFGMVSTSAFLLLSGLTEDFWKLTLWRVLAGVTGALAFIAGGVLAASLFKEHSGRNAMAITLYFGGGGVGVILSGALLPLLFATQGQGEWPLAWVLLGLASLLCCLLSLWAAATFTVPPKASQKAPALPWRGMRYELLSYGLFATGYIIYFTFLVAWMRALDTSPAIVALVWVTVGVAIVVSPFLWGPILAKNATGRPLALAAGIVALGTLLPVALPTPTGLFLSAALFGIAVFAAPGAVTSFSRQNLPQSAWAKSVSAFTLVFAVCQTVGPLAAGAIGDMFGSISYGLVLAGVMLALAALVALMQSRLTN